MTQGRPNILAVTPEIAEQRVCGAIQVASCKQAMSIFKGFNIRTSIQLTGV